MRCASKVWIEYPFVSNPSNADPKRDNWASIKEKKNQNLAWA